MNNLLRFFAVGIIFAPLFVGAVDTNNSNIISAFKSFVEVESIAGDIPEIVEVQFDDSFNLGQYAVYNVDDGIFEPYSVIQSSVDTEIPIESVKVDGVNTLQLYDGRNDTFSDFDFNYQKSNFVSLSIETKDPITASGFTYSLGQYVALPNSIAVWAVDDDGSSRVVVAEQRVDSQTVRFAETTAKKWTVLLRHSQPLRITELDFIQLGERVIRENVALRFLAQPGNKYVVYSDPDRYVSVPTGERPNLLGKEFTVLGPYQSQDNPTFIISDKDNDGVPDVSDNCISISNSDQLDENNNGRGDVCDDNDFDGVLNNIDNCPNEPNARQLDEDVDGVGDVCDGQESRFTEQNPWIIWFAIIFLVIVLVSLTYFAVRHERAEMQKKEEDDLVAPEEKDEDVAI